MKKIFTLLVAALLATASSAYAQCASPTNLAVSYSNNVSSFTWNAVPGANSYLFEIGWAGGQWEYGVIPVNTNSYQLTGLMQGGNFQWRVTADCGTLSAPSATAFYNTPCVPPFNLSATNITTNSATLNWQQGIDNANNTGFSVSYRLANTNNAWTQLTNIYNNPTATFFNITGLAPGTSYEWRVRRACSAANSPYQTSSFTTLACISNGVNTEEWIDLFALGTINRISGAEPGGYKQIPGGTDLQVGSVINGQISAGFPGTVRNQRFSVYIDFNRNGSFADAGERLVNSVSINNAGIKNFSISIPSNATAGPTRMRVIMRRNPGTISPCITGYQGETEDYAVNLVVSGNRSAVIPVTKTISLSMPASTDPGFAVSPNPSNGIFTILLPEMEEAVSLEVVNMNGASVLRRGYNPNKVLQIDISNQPAGLYVLRILNKDGKQLTQKIQKR